VRVNDRDRAAGPEPETLMATPRTRLRLVLLQLRKDELPLRQEQGCFLERCRVARHQVTCINLADQPGIGWRHVEDAHAIIIGGAGDFSVTEEHPFTAPLRDVTLRLIDEARPVFGSCWGHQFLAEITGGRVVEDPDRAEIGSHRVHLTHHGRVDPLFEGFPERFFVQLGHKDRVASLGPGWRELARSDLCAHQAIRLHGRPVYGTQFHSEMDEHRLRERLEVYLDDYVPDPDQFAEVLRRLRPSIEADRLLSRFLELYA
jgi:GMP synthase (glutamine-hydrolysing)